jgi:hypothetical protein
MLANKRAPSLCHRAKVLKWWYQRAKTAVLLVNQSLTCMGESRADCLLCVKPQSQRSVCAVFGCDGRVSCCVDESAAACRLIRTIQPPTMTRIDGRTHEQVREVLDGQRRVAIEVSNGNDAALLLRKLVGQRSEGEKALASLMMAEQVLCD